LEAFSRQDLPFEKVVEELRLERGAGTTLFQAVLIYHNEPPPGGELAGGVTLEPYSAHSGTAKFDLTLAVGEAAAGGSGWAGE